MYLGLNLPSQRAARIAQGVARRAGRGIVDLMFPPGCLACRQATADPDGLCAECWQSLRLIEQPFCERLGTPFAVDLDVGALLSPEAMANPPVYGRARAVARFEGAARLLVHRLKFGDRLELARAMGGWMARAGDALLADADVLIPVPLHRRRLATRQYNQSALLARAVSAQCGVPVSLGALRRKRSGRPQVGLSRGRRALNVQAAFQVEPTQVADVIDRSVVLVDDVVTSGATVNAAARALLKGGARRVDVLAFAMVMVG